MAIGNRIKFFRKMKGLTQKELGKKLGFSGRTSDVRMAQYESETRVPKDDLVKQLAIIFGVNPKAITVPNIDNIDNLMHTLFALEDMYGFRIDMLQNEICLRIRPFGKPIYTDISRRFSAWYNVAKKYRDEEISQEEYDHWRYNFPDTDTTILKAFVPPEDWFK